MKEYFEKPLLIAPKNAKFYRYSNETCLDAAHLYNDLTKKIGCTYILYLYENLNTKEKFVYSSNWAWQDLLIGNRLINHCPIFLSAFNYLETRKTGHIFLPWYLSPPRSREERNVCGLRSEFNIANGFGYGSKGNNIRESLAFGGEKTDVNFYKNFISNPTIFDETLSKMRLIVLLKNHNKKLITKQIIIKQ